MFGFEHWIELEDGSERWLSSNAAPILGDDGTVERVVVGLDDATRLNAGGTTGAARRDEPSSTLAGGSTSGDGSDSGTPMKGIYGTPEYNPTLEEAIKQYHPNDRAAVRDAIDTCHDTGEPMEREARRQTATKPSAGSDSGPNRRFATGRRNSRPRDITQDKEREQRLMVMSRILRHNIRNKLTVIRGNSRLLKEELGSSDFSVDAASGHIDRIENASKELDSLAERARTFDRAIERDLRNGTLHLEQTLVDIRDDLTVRQPGATAEEDALAGRLLRWLETQNDFVFAQQEVPVGIQRSAATLDREITTDRTLGGSSQVSAKSEGSAIPEMERDVLDSETEGPVAHSRGLGLWAVTGDRRGGARRRDHAAKHGSMFVFPLAQSE